ncbi:serine protease [Streptomyces sp. NPDC046925]|uniref:S1 family peptidase n=1 Tax=Streptomyces sp. NPDC046925 TaxID=3155375 RepID=UPI0033CB585D
MTEQAGSKLDFYSRYAPCLVCVETRGKDGALSVGTAFHIGDGYLVTVRHVVESREIASLVPHTGTISVDSVEVIYPADETVDLALLRTDFSLEHYMKYTNIMLSDGPVREKTEHIEIGGHLDDWIVDTLILTEVVILGYPPIPSSPAPVLVATRGEVNAVIDPYMGSKHPLFVLSPMARGGFSGGPALTSNGYLLGVITTSLLTDYNAPELGYGVALTVEPLWNLLLENRIYPGIGNRELMVELFDLPDELPIPERKTPSSGLSTLGSWDGGDSQEPPF